MTLKLTHPSMALASLSSLSSSSSTTTTQLNFQCFKLCSSFPFSKPSLPLPSTSHVVSNSLHCSASVEDNEWDWEQWTHHFHEVDEQERLLHILKSRLADALRLEDYEDAATLKVAIATLATKDTVGTVISHLNRAIDEERYSDAALLRDGAGTGLVGWWAGVSKDINDPHGLIIRITPEHGRYVARSYSPRQLAASAAGVPLFEIFLVNNKNAEFKSQVVYLKHREAFHTPPTTSSEVLDAAERLGSVGSPEDPEVVADRNDNSDAFEGMPGFQNVLEDAIPGVKIKVLKVTTPDKLDNDIIYNLIEQLTEEEGDEDEDADKDNETESPELKDINSETDDEIELNSSLETFEREEQNKIALEVVGGGLVQKFPSSLTTRNLLRVPAKLETTGQGSFSFTIEKVVNQQVGHGKEKPSPSDKSTKIQLQHSDDRVLFNVAKLIGRGKVPSKVLEDFGELISLCLSRARNHEQLSWSTMFSRIEIPTSLDPLNGLYIGAPGLYSSEVIQLRCRYGHWLEDGGPKEPSNLEFYEYVEALKLTGNPYVPAGQVAFRAKVGERYQLPVKGILPEVFGLIGRYKGQGRLAGPRFQNPEWVDGELMILDGKYIKAGPVVGFMYWAPKDPFLVFFNRLTLQQ